MKMKFEYRCPNCGKLMPIKADKCPLCVLKERVKTMAANAVKPTKHNS